MLVSSHMSAPNLLDLPTELIAILPNYLHSLDDHYLLLRTCRTLYMTCANSNAKLAPDFAKKYGQPLLRPHPHLLLAGTARQIGDWAVQSEQNREELLKAIQSGNDGLLKLAVEVARLSLEDVRRIYKTKFDVINPISRTLDWEVGQGHWGRELEENEIELMTICEDVEQALYNYVIYCELFHHSIDKALEPSLPIEPLSQELRQWWMAYCRGFHHSVSASRCTNPCTFPPGMPDSNNDRNNVRKEFQLLDFVVLYQSKGWASYRKVSELLLAKTPDQYGRENVPDHDSLSPHEKLFVNVVGHQGLATIQMLLPGGMEAVKDLIATVREKVDAVPNAQILWDAEHIGTEADTMHVGWFSMFHDVKCGMGWVGEDDIMGLEITV